MRENNKCIHGFVLQRWIQDLGRGFVSSSASGVKGQSTSRWSGGLLQIVSHTTMMCPVRGQKSNLLT